MVRPKQPDQWVCAERVLELKPRPLVMGILNVTPDSFSDGGLYADPAAAVEHALRMQADGADIIDVGGESTRPGATPVAEDTELARVIPVIAAIRKRTDVVISVDTTKAAVARAALAAGAQIVNDVSACTADPEMVSVVHASGAGVVLMHMRGTPRTMQAAPEYGDVIAEVRDYLEARALALESAGVDRARIAIDPGIGFGKTVEHNTSLLGRLDEIASLGRPLVVGLSRKRMLDALTGRPVAQRLAGSLAGLAWCVGRGAQIVRVHDVAESRDAADVTTALMEKSARE